MQKTVLSLEGDLLIQAKIDVQGNVENGAAAGAQPEVPLYLPRPEIAMGPRSL